MGTGHRRRGRLSDDGQMILDVDPRRSERCPDLLVCGAPLRNRTVDLLLTMNDRTDSPPGQTCPDQGKPWLTQALNGYTSLSPAPFCPPNLPPEMISGHDQIVIARSTTAARPQAHVYGVPETF